ncbi:hypothetical protein [Halobacillus massiliensis]|uniref:hypothetical protein n=1 Tax=Halobacillus massiliensis TaxID=1926286 RepID=UPI0009E5634E|nr:hypothetical protein [Halobacillus massiliensis]
MSQPNFMYVIGIVSYISWVLHLMFNPSPYEAAVLNEGWLYLIIAVPVYFMCVFFYGWMENKGSESADIISDQDPVN